MSYIQEGIEDIKQQTQEKVKNPVKTDTATLEDTQSQAISNKHHIMIGVNFVLALISVYLFEFWFNRTLTLESLQMVENFAVVFLTAVTYFIAKTYYNKGVVNTFKKIAILVTLFLTIIGLMLLSVSTPSDIIYPLSGIIIISIGFYMISLSSGTINSGGMVGLSLIIATPIIFLKYFGVIEWGMVSTLSKFGVFLILFIGGTWAELRAIIHGIRGTNSDSGFGAVDENMEVQESGESGD